MIHQNWISIRIDDDKTCRAGGVFICFLFYFDVCGFELLLEIPNVCKRIPQVFISRPLVEVYKLRYELLINLPANSLTLSSNSGITASTSGESPIYISCNSMMETTKRYT